MVELMPKKELEKAYLDTTYSVFIDENKYAIKIGSPVPSIINKLFKKEKSAVIITAWNPRSKALPAEENEVRNKKLYSNLIDNKYIIYKALGQGIDASWPAEEGFFIIGLKKADAEKIAVEYGQYAYLSLEVEKSASLVFTSIWYD